MCWDCEADGLKKHGLMRSDCMLGAERDAYSAVD